MHRASVFIALAVAGLLAGCSSATDGPVPIARGTQCNVCGMGIQNMRYACERSATDGMHMYDSIECLLRDSEAKGAAWLADYDTQALHAVDSMWIVQGDIPSPMGGGLAAFLERAVADEVATQTSGVVSSAGVKIHSATGATS